MRKLVLSGLSFSFDRRPHGSGSPERPGAFGFSDLDLSFGEGRVSTLLGKNGSGKSTVLRLIAGILKPQAGTISWDNRNLRSLGPRSRARIVSMVSQNAEARPSYSVTEFLLMGRYSRLPALHSVGRDDQDFVRRLLAEWDFEEYSNRLIGDLSGGEYQKALILRSLAQDTPIVLFDEASNNLDPAAQAFLSSTVRTLARQGRLVIMVLHDVYFASSVSDDVALLEDGRLRAFGLSEEILKPDLLKKVYGTDFQVLESQMSLKKHLVPLL